MLRYESQGSHLKRVKVNRMEKKKLGVIKENTTKPSAYGTIKKNFSLAVVED